jgi:L-threonylcarbamoyladenylate synthase
LFVDIDTAEKILNQGGNVIIPTETVYGLAGSIHHPEAIEAIYRLKKRPKENPLIVHVSNMEQVKELILPPPKSFFDLTEAFWPGPLTLIVEGKENLNKSVTAGLSTIAIRMPKHPQTLELIKRTGPLAAPSANLSGKPSGTRFIHLENDFGKSIPILEGDHPVCGVESTILAWMENKWKILRPGFLDAFEIEKVLGHPLDSSSKQIAPGMRFKHYSPNAKLITGLELIDQAEAIIGYENRKYPKHIPFYSLGKDHEVEIMAYRLYDTFRKMDEEKFSKVWIDTNLPNTGLFSVLLERIKKALDQ